MKMGKERRTIVVCICLSAICFCGIMAFMLSAPKPTKPYTDISDRQLSTPYRVHYSYSWEDGDLKGDWSDEVAVSYILLRANKMTMERTDISNRVDGNVYADNRAASLSEALNRLLPVTDVAIPTNAPLLFLPTPSIIWLNDGVRTKPVVFLYADEATVTVADPDSGVISLPFSETHRQYDAAIRQAIFIADRGYTSIDS